MSDTSRQAALNYHEKPVPGKTAIVATKPLSNQNDLALAYSPGVAYACEEIVKDPRNVARYTGRSNLVGVITNGSAVLGLGNIGALASKPVMEGKAVLFKKFSGLDVFDIEINESDPDKLVDIIAALEPTFGGINLEDIKAPECFEVERKLRERMAIPVFHDDQHGTAITVCAAFINGLELVEKKIDEIKLVVSGAGAAAIACIELMVDLGLPRENIWLTDIEGVVYQGRTELMDEQKASFAQATELRTLGEVIENADVFLGLSAGGVLKPEMVKRMGSNPLILALANPYPEITPDEAHAVRDDVVMATGRSDFPNQVNNVLCFPYIFRGALDAGATSITRGMEKAAVYAIANLAREEQNERVAAAYGNQELSFGKEYFIPKPFDPRLIVRIAPAVAQAAVADGVATQPIADMQQYAAELERFVYQSGAFMSPIFSAAKQLVAEGRKSRIVFTEGEEERVLRAVQVIVDEGLATPILIGRPEVIKRRIKRYGLRFVPGKDVEITDSQKDERFHAYWNAYWQMRGRHGITRDMARTEVRRRMTLIGALMVHFGEADGMVCGTVGAFSEHLRYVDQVIGLAPEANTYAAMNILLLPERTLAVVDTHINETPTAAQIAEFTQAAAEQMRRLDIEPKAALLSHSNFGSSESESSQRLREALALIQQQAPELEIEGEMHADCALNESIREHVLPSTGLNGEANLLVCPNIEAGNIAYNLLKTAGGGNIAIGPFLLGVKSPVTILTSSATVRRIVNMAAVTVVRANREENTLLIHRHK